MSTTHSTTGLTQTTASTSPVSSAFNNFWGAFQEWCQWERLRTDLCNLNDRSQWTSALRAARSTTSPRTEIPTRDASDPRDERLLSGTGRGQFGLRAMAHKRPVERRLSAILAADLAGYSRLMMHNAEDYGCQADRAFSVRPCQNPIPRLQKGLLNDYEGWR
jgi:hypothetical protein